MFTATRSACKFISFRKDQKKRRNKERKIQVGLFLSKSFQKWFQVRKIWSTVIQNSKWIFSTKKQKINLFSPFQCPSLFLIGVFSPYFIILDLKDSFNKFSRYVLWTYFVWFYCSRLVTKRSENYFILSWIEFAENSTKFWIPTPSYTYIRRDNDINVKWEKKTFIKSCILKINLYSFPPFNSYVIGGKGWEG